jgi:solute carrier family 25 phosphate transporter 23/24/25/41
MDPLPLWTPVSRPTDGPPVAQLFTAGGTRELDTPLRLTAGALAGISSVGPYSASAPCTWHLLKRYTHAQSQRTLSISVNSGVLYLRLLWSDVGGIVRSRLSIVTASISASHLDPGTRIGIRDMTVKVYREEGGIRALYRGLVPTAVVRLLSLS